MFNASNIPEAEKQGIYSRHPTKKTSVSHSSQEFFMCSKKKKSITEVHPLKGLHHRNLLVQMFLYSLLKGIQNLSQKKIRVCPTKGLILFLQCTENTVLLLGVVEINFSSESTHSFTCCSKSYNFPLAIKDSLKMSHKWFNSRGC